MQLYRILGILLVFLSTFQWKIFCSFHTGIKPSNSIKTQTLLAHFWTYQPKNPQQSYEMTKVVIISRINPILSTKTWGKASFTLYTKWILEIFKYTQCWYSNIINYYSEVYGMFFHNLRFHRFTQNWWFLGWKSLHFSINFSHLHLCNDL